MGIQFFWLPIEERFCPARKIQRSYPNFSFLPKCHKVVNAFHCWILSLDERGRNARYGPRQQIRLSQSFFFRLSQWNRKKEEHSTDDKRKAKLIRHMVACKTSIREKERERERTIFADVCVSTSGGHIGGDSWFRTITVNIRVISHAYQPTGPTVDQ